MSTILVVTNGPLARNPRVVKEASALGAAGHAVTVLGIRNHSPSVPLDTTLAAGAPFTHLQINLLPDASDPRARARVWLRRLRIRFARDLAHRAGLPSIHALGPAAALLAATRTHPADLVIVHNEIPHWIGTRLLAEGRRVAADIEDWHSEDLLPGDRAGRPLALLRRVEHALLHRAVHTTTTSHALASALHARHGGRLPEVVTNSFPLPPAGAGPSRLAPGSTSLPPAFFWFSQTTGPGRGLEAFVAAWTRTTRPSRLVLLGEVSGDYDRHLLSLMPGNFRSRVEFLPLVPPDELPAVIARHDIGLALEQAAIVNRDLTITNKILQYLGAHLAVVATPTAGQREVLAHAPEAGLLHDFSAPAAAAVALDSLLADPAALARRRASARRLAETRYCWELESPRLLATVQRALTAPR